MLLNLEGREFEAIRAAEQAIRLSPGNADFHLTLARAQVNFRDPRMALVTFGKLRSLRAEWTEDEERELSEAKEAVRKLEISEATALEEFQAKASEKRAQQSRSETGMLFQF